jgi:hypothetical protein
MKTDEELNVRAFVQLGSNILNLNRLIFRGWYYFRTGYSTYVAFPLGFISTVIVIYSLGIKPVIESGGTLGSISEFIFPHLINFIIIGVVVMTPICVGFGAYHMKRRPYEADASVGVEQNPYTYKAIPGKEEEVFIPLWTLTAKALVRILEHQQTSLSPEERAQLEEALRKAELLRERQTVGVKPESMIHF